MFPGLGAASKALTLSCSALALGYRRNGPLTVGSCTAKHFIERLDLLVEVLTPPLPSPRPTDSTKLLGSVEFKLLTGLLRALRSSEVVHSSL
jgi:hypothetical protein